MSMLEWAERECRLLCKQENPDFDFDDDNAFDYGCSCYKSALKAYKSLSDDGHSGFSFNVTKNILIKLMKAHPLSPITDDDFFINESRDKIDSLEPSAYFTKIGLKSHIQCPRMSSLFREETLDGKILYHDIDRAVYVNIEDPSDTFYSDTKIIDEMFPITMPYVPEKEPYKIYSQTFLAHENNGDYDTVGIPYIVTPDGKKIDVNIYKTEKNGNFVEITEDEYNELLSKRVDKVSHKIATKLLWTLISNSASEDETDRREAWFRKLDDKTKKNYIDNLESLCNFFNSPENYQYNSFEIKQSLCRGNLDEYKNVPELVDIANYLQNILKEIK